MLPQASDYHILKPSPNAIPIPKVHKFHTSKRQTDDLPREGDKFGESDFTWKEFVTHDLQKNPAQVKIDLSKTNQVWYYMGKKSTEAKAQFTEDIINKPRFNPKGHFLETLPKPAYPLAVATPRQSYPASHPNQNALNPVKMRPQQQQQPTSAARPDKPYNYKPRIPADPAFAVDPQALQQQRTFQNAIANAVPFGRGINSTPQAWKSTLNSVNFLPPSIRDSQSSSSTGSTVGRTINHSPFGGRAAYGTAVNSSGRPSSNNTRYSSRPNPFARYAYLQLQHNRSPLEYKSPYMPNGGFMNGYQGSLMKHLQHTPNALSKYTSDAANRHTSSPSLLNNYKSSNLPQSKPSLNRYPEVYSSNSASYPNSNTNTYGPRSNAYTSATSPSMPLHSTASPAFTPSSYAGYGSQNNHAQQSPLPSLTGSKTSLANTWEKKDQVMHPAIRKEYMFHNQYQPPQPLPHIPQPKSDNSLYQSYKPQQFQPEMSNQFQAVKPEVPLYQFQPIKQPEIPVQQFQPAKQQNPVPRQQNSYSSSHSPSNGIPTQQEHKPVSVPPSYETPKPQYPHQQYFQKPHQPPSDYSIPRPEVTKPHQETFQQLPSIHQLAPMLQQQQHHDEPTAKIAECPPDIKQYVSSLMLNLRKAAE